MSISKVKKKTLIISISTIIVLAVAIAMVLFINLQQEKTISEINELEAKRYLAYNEITDSDANIDNCEYVKFNSFFIKDLDGDGYAEKYDGTCNQIDKKATLYFEINVLTDGRLENGKITIDGKNFNLATALIKDDVIQNDYIDKNIREIGLNTVQYGTQKIFSGNIVANMNNNINNYSVTDNKVILTGTWVSSDGNNSEDIRKEITLKTDWYGKTITTTNIDVDSIETNHTIITSLQKDNVTLSFDVGYKEEAGELLIQEQKTEVEIPDFNGYAPVDVVVSSQNCKYEYNKDTRILTISRKAIINNEGFITNSVPRTNIYNIQIKYSLEAYESIINHIVNITIPTTGYYYGFNNSSEEYKEQNPYISQANKSWTHTWQILEADSENPGTKGRMDVYVGKEIYNSDTKSYSHVISKEKPLQIYNNIEQEEKSDEYVIAWRAYAGETSTNQSGIYMRDYKPEEFLNSLGQYISMESYIHTKGVYFSNVDRMLGKDGWLKVYDEESESTEPLLTLTKENFNEYTSSNPYYFERKVNKIRVETSKVKDKSYLFVYQIKEIDDEKLTNNYTLEQFNNLNYIYSYMSGGFYENSHTMSRELVGQSYAYYESQVSLVSFEVDPFAINNFETKKVTMQITTESSRYNEAKWKDGFFVIEMPKEILEVNLNSVNSSNPKVEVTSYEVYEKDGKQYVRIYTKNDTEESFMLRIDADLTADSRKPTVTKPIKLYGINPNVHNYRVTSRAQDILDINNNDNKIENVLYKTYSLQIVAPSSLNVSQTLSNFDDNGTEVVSPQTAILDKSDKVRDANINIILTNNYSRTISETVIVGKIPFEGNKYQINGKELGSTYSVTMKNTGVVVPEKLQKIAKIYYSTNSDTDSNLADSSNNWKTSEEVTDWSQIKTYAIDLGDYVLQKGEILTFTYGIVIPPNINYNDVSYSTYGVYFYLDTEDGKLKSQTEVNRLGIMIAKKYDILLTKYKQGSNTKVKGATYRATDGTNTKTGITNEQGEATISGLYVENDYTLEEIASPESYVLNKNKVKFKVTVDDSGTPNITTTGEIRDEATINNVAGTYVASMAVEDVAKYDVKLIKKDVTTGELLKGVKFKLTGGIYGESGGIFTTNAVGEISIMNLVLGTPYTLEETNASGYYVDSAKKTFTVTRNEEGKLVITDGISNATISELDGVDKAVITTEIVNEKIPTYSLNINKNDKDNNKLEGTQFKLTSTDTGEKFYATTDENGIATFEGLYQFVTGKDITGEYTLEEIMATEGYMTDTTPVKFKAELKNEALDITMIGGKDVVKSSTSDNTSITFNIENKPIFKLTKTGDNGEPLANAKFKITDLDGNLVKDVNGNTLEILATDENGEIIANLLEGLYQVEEVEAPEGYQLPEKVEDRIYYVGIGKNRPQEIEFGTKFVKPIIGSGYSEIYDMKATDDGGYVVAGSFTGECDMNADGIPDITAQGSTDAYIAKFNKDGEYEWHYVLGTTGEDEFKRIDLTADGGYVAVGYEYSSTYRDSVVVKIDGSGTQVWKTKPVTVPEGKNAYDDELTSVKVIMVENEENIVITGNFYGEEVNVGNKTHTNANKRHQGFVAWLDIDGNYIKSIALTGKDISASVRANVNVTDVTLTNLGIAVSVDYVGVLNVNGNELNTVSNQQDTVIIRYSPDGNYQGYTLIAGDKTESIGRMITDSKGNIIALGGFGSTLTLGSDTITPKTEDVLNAIMLKFTADGSYISNSNYVIGSDSVHNDNKFTSAVPTSDGGLLIGGWFYSGSIDVDGDGSNDIDNKSDLEGDGILIKLEEDGTVKWSKQIGGSKIDVTNAVAELNDGTYVAAGSFDSKSLAIDKTEDALTMQGATDAYVIAFGDVITTAEIPQRQTIDVTNELKKFKVTTEIDENTEGERIGGTIAGAQTDEEYINFVEEVKYGYSNTLPIVITPDENYSVYKVTVNDEEVLFVPDENGVVTLPLFECVTHDYHIKVIFEKNISSVLVHHYLKDREGNLTTMKLAEDESYTGKVGSNYSTLPKMDIEVNGIAYNIAKVVDLEGYEKVGNYTLPQNRSGKHTDEQIVVTYYYEELPFTLTVHHYLEGTEDSLVEDEISSKYKGDSFETNYSEKLLEDYDVVAGATIVNLNSDEYTMNDDTQKVTGNIIKDTEVTYSYKLKEYNVTTKVNEITITRHNELTNEYEEVTVKGGSISGENENPYETIQRGNDSIKEIKVVPDDGYRIKKITMKNGDSEPAEIEFTPNDDGSVILDQFTMVTENKQVVAEFEPIKGKVIVHHYIKGTTIQVPLDEETIAKDEEKIGYVGDPYATKQKENIAYGYEYDSAVGETNGKYIDGTIEVTYYYRVLVDIDIVKKWNHTNNIYDKPESITVELLADGEIIQVITMTKENKITVEGELTNQETWEYIVTKLPKYNDNDGHEIVYTVREK